MNMESPTSRKEREKWGTLGLISGLSTLRGMGSGPPARVCCYLYIAQNAFGRGVLSAIV
jgi:hypothetical protein